ncbi:type VI secretion protein [bacteria symbiont BFo1 of Frankliniella occidentalis]|uniref:Type VI secretion system baseplate subunit TssK n=1 Tax=Erwinia aphidicola TaxID=68334 RepID=A0ABU8DH55_ERWAP|nr:type VI secretion system baseplate subunit TssK [Erwinia aphidicola]KMV67179.1 type VI secretion protein [bacteria symbiont BFo1 of Frankliniella occidentalis]PIJ55111.1 type VI secretion system-associated protein [Erwinia sp. OLMDLW33]KYP83264.1 type VI secretion protein [bacteria symbiont BFo1 of Frankliniella occidentalis]KYP88279.1 type VI secretion protein [bacteria symbiont BFo1 of Frankliniella occidentalis]MBD1375318.1 type VI secretion system baseplate subunit TssK [Erwinia aphidic
MRTNKVVWSEGLFLRPQLFQQQERYFEYYAHKRASTLSPFYWGFSQYEIDREALAYGKLVLRSARGVLPDGTPFDIPDHADLPEPLTILPEHLGKTLCLAVPLRLDNSDETIFSQYDNSSLARFRAQEAELCDTNSIRQGPKPVQLAKLRLKLVSQDEMTESWIGLTLTRVKAIQPDGSVLLHLEDHIPPVTGYAANHLLTEWLTHLNGLVKMRAEMLATRLSTSDGKASASAEVVDYLLLQIFNKYEPILDHLRNIPELPPIVLYEELAKLAGELSTFVRTKTRRPKPAPGYDHARLYPSIRPLVDDVHDLLNQILVRAGQLIDLHHKGNGVWSAAILPNELLSFTNLVLAVHAQLPMDVLQQQFHAQAKISAPQQLHELVRSHLPGLVLQGLPVPPRQIPYSSGYVYFELLKSGPFWEKISTTGALALHIAGEFPGLKMDLWGIRG